MSLDPISLLEAALKINRRAAVLIAGGFLVLAIAILLGNQVKDAGVSLWQMAGALLGFSILVAIFAQIDDLLARVASWALVILALIWASALTGQVIAGNTLGYAKIDCLTGFWKPGACSVSPASFAGTSSDPATAGEVTVDIVVASASEVAEPAPVDRASANVFVQFEGYDRDTIKVLARKLVDLGWAVQGADQGGERISSAASLNEVRFFHPDDKLRAERLAQDVYDAMGGASSMTVVDVTGLKKWARDRPGHLEIWISE